VRCGSTALPNRERWIAAAVLVLLVVLRSIVFGFWEQSFFDSDQAITRLMAKHLIEGRAFPVFTRRCSRPTAGTSPRLCTPCLSG
jgi:hypothetical protein